MSFPETTIGTHLLNVKKCDPKKDLDGQQFLYVDLSSVDKSKKIIEPKLVDWIDAISAPSRARQVLNSGDVIVSTVRPNLNGVALVCNSYDDAIASTGYCVLRPDKSKLDSSYLYYWVRSTEFISNMSKLATGANYPAVTDKVVKNSLIPTPPLPIQRHIAKVLDQADQLRRQAQQMETELNQLAQSVFLDMFGDFRREDTSNFVSLSECAEVISGITKGQSLANHETVMLPYLRVANVQDGYLDLSEIKEIEVKKSSRERYLLKKGDVLLTEGGDFDKLGRGAIWNGQISPCAHQNHVFRVRLDTSFFKPKFFECFLQTPYAKGYFLRCAKRTTNLASINITQLKNLMLPPVDLKKQEEFEGKLHAIAGIKKELASTSEDYEALFQSLTQKAFKGELALPDSIKDVTLQQESNDHEQLCLSNHVA